MPVLLPPAPVEIVVIRAAAAHSPAQPAVRHPVKRPLDAPAQPLSGVQVPDTTPPPSPPPTATPPTSGS
jgi:hypothetical protein